MIDFILASASPRRRELLATLGLTFTISKPAIDETQHPGEPPLVYAERLSRAKAAAIYAQIVDRPNAAIIAADTIVIDSVFDPRYSEDPELRGDVLGKPADAAEAHAMLTRLRGRSHTVMTAVTLLHTVGGAIRWQRTAHAVTRVTLRDYTDAEIAAYIATGDPFDKAGGYAIQHVGFHPVARIDGSETNVIGLPIETLTALLVAAGLR